MRREDIDAERFWLKVAVRSEGECWEWEAYRDAKGYGRFSINNSPQKAHRVSYLLVKGDIPEGLVVRHDCDNPSCVNPNHLRLGSDLENQTDKKERGRVRGSRNPRARLTEDMVRMIRRSVVSGQSQRKTAEAFGISFAAVNSIMSGKTWAHVH